ncbi:MAG: hypothetical protein KGJ11_03380, partial [Candidatus Omnitrophica bacterium]|nr:hypothetical protein [Candidatus Omnitrophota bacterium]
CNMAYRRQFLMENRFDTTFKFCAGDDVDLCFRAQQTGKSIYYTQAARVIHYHRSLFKNTLQQQFGYGFMRVYINLKYFKFPFVNIGTIVIAVSVILACIGIYLKSLLFLEFGVTFFSIYLFLILYLCFRSKQGNPLLIIYSFPGQLIASSVNCGGNIYFLVKKFFKMIGV